MQHQQMLAQSSQSQPQQVQADTQEKSEGTPVKAEETGKGQEKQQEKPQREPRKAKSAIAQSSNAVPVRIDVKLEPLVADDFIATSY